MTAHVVGGDEIHFPHLHPQTDQIFLIPTLRQAQWKEKRDGLKHGIAEQALRPPVHGERNSLPANLSTGCRMPTFRAAPALCLLL